jgi:hypothetical protein
LPELQRADGCHHHINSEEKYLKFSAITLFVPVVLGACAAPTQDASAPEASTSVCGREVPTGSLISVTRCRSQTQIEQDRAAAEEAARTIRPSSSSTGKAGT